MRHEIYEIELKSNIEWAVRFKDQGKYADVPFQLDRALWYWQVAEPLTWTDIEKNFAENPGRE